MTNSTRTQSSYFSVLINPLFLVFFLLQLSLAASKFSYTPTDEILLDCGSSGNTTAFDGRKWSGDVASKFTPPENPQSAQGFSGKGVPYGTARISRSQFSYKFPVAGGPKFVRLYFNPLSYPGFDTADAAFSVKTGDYTLLQNLSYTSMGDHDGFFREFIVEVEVNQMLNITFTPSVSNSYAFVNGIEILSMPASLYYTQAGHDGPPYLGQRRNFTIKNNTALETLYRFNVGGKSLSQIEDPLFRNWAGDDGYFSFGSDDFVYVYWELISKINYTQLPEYTAPREVYGTFRAMGNNKTANYLSNLTWTVPVDSGFMYLIRLHYCEFIPEIVHVGDRRFIIYINGQIAEASADVIKWSGGRFLPTYRDYVVMMKREQGKKKYNISVAVCPVQQWRTKYSAAGLNGLELFKLNDSNGNLAGPEFGTPTTQAPVGPIAPKSASGLRKRTLYIAIAGSIIGGLILLSASPFLVLWKRGKVSGRDFYGGAFGPALCWWWREPFNSESVRTKNSSLPEKLCRHFTAAQIRDATNCFDDTLVLGRGGFGNVYKGTIDNNKLVAIRRLNPGSKQGATEFATEIQLLSQLRHRHLVTLIGYCEEEREMVLVHEYMTKGTLRDHLYENKEGQVPLPWKKRLEICIGAAKGLHYLHAGASPTIIHRDVKTTNILLDKNLVAKVSDFGLSKMGQTSVPNGPISTAIKGTFGYMDPEYIKRRQLTEKSDVYSFGVVLLEVLCARKAVNHDLPYDEINLAHWAKSCIRNGTLEQFIDPYLKGKIAPLCFRKFVEIAEVCLRDRGKDRPTMGDVVGSLELALELQESMEEMRDEIEEFKAFQEITFRDGGGVGGGEIETSAGFNASGGSAPSHLLSTDYSSSSSENASSVLPDRKEN